MVPIQYSLRCAEEAAATKLLEALKTHQDKK